MPVRTAMTNTLIRRRSSSASGLDPKCFCSQFTWMDSMSWKDSRLIRSSADRLRTYKYVCCHILTVSCSRLRTGVNEGTAARRKWPFGVLHLGADEEEPAEEPDIRLDPEV